jgi:hypothetical protein
VIVDPFREQSLMLARQVLGYKNPDDPSPHSAVGDPRVASAQLRVDVRLESMVRGICQQLWVDSAGIAANAEARVREALSQTNIEFEIAKEVKHQLDDMRRWITDRVRKRIEQLVDQAIDERIGQAPQLLAKKITGKMWSAFTGRSTGKSDIYGRGRDKRAK